MSQELTKKEISDIPILYQNFLLGSIHLNSPLKNSQELRDYFEIVDNYLNGET